jgi:hypothetical protein
METSKEIRPEGGTPAGGVRAVAYFRDENGNPTEQAKAYFMEILKAQRARWVVSSRRVPAVEPKVQRRKAQRKAKMFYTKGVHRWVLASTKQITRW